MAKYTNITKPQVMAIRNLLVLLSQPPPSTSSGSRNNSKNGRPSSSSPETTTSTNDEPNIMIQRKHLKKAIQKVNLAKNPDQEVIDLIFTLWCQYDDSDSDEAQQENRDKNLGSEVVLPAQCKKASRSNQVPWYEFLISISLLACKTDTFEQSIRFTLYVVHRNQFYNNNGSKGNKTAMSTNKSQQGCISSTDAISFLQGTFFVAKKHILIA